MLGDINPEFDAALREIRKGNYNIANFDISNDCKVDSIFYGINNNTELNYDYNGEKNKYSPDEILIPPMQCKVDNIDNDLRVIEISN